MRSLYKRLFKSVDLEWLESKQKSGRIIAILLISKTGPCLVG